MDFEAIREKLTIVNVTSLTSESVIEYEHDVDQTLADVERQLEMEMQKKHELGNRIGVVQSLVTELWDRVDKARRRESDISCRVTAWAQHLAEQMSEVKQKKARMGVTMDSSAALSAEIQESLERLAEKRDGVMRMREEIDYRRHLHKQQLKDLKEDCEHEEHTLKYWNAKAVDIEKAVEALKENRGLLAERLEEEKRMEQEQKKRLEELEMMLKKAMSSGVRNSNFVTSFSDLTEESN